MNRFSISLNNEVDNKLKNYMNIKNIKSKSKAINNILNLYLQNELNFSNARDVDVKLERILKMESLLKDLIEQLFSNLGFRENRNSFDDEMLKDFYKKIKKSNFIFFD